MSLGNAIICSNARKGFRQKRKSSFSRLCFFDQKAKKQNYIYLFCSCLFVNSNRWGSPKQKLFCFCAFLLRGAKKLSCFCCVSVFLLWWAIFCFFVFVARRGHYYVFVFFVVFCFFVFVCFVTFQVEYPDTVVLLS